MAKILSLEEAKRLRQDLRTQGKTLVTTNGSFDILHPAHTNILQKAKTYGDILLVLVNSDSSIKQNKDPKRPILPEKDRMHLVSHLAPVDYVTKFDDKEVAPILNQLKPDVHIKGGTFIPERIAKEKEIVEKHGGKHICLPLEEGYSSTNIIEEILKRYQ